MTYPSRMMRRQGFTLVELVVVVMVLGILAGAATGRILDAGEEARRRTLRTSVDAIITVVEIRTAQRGGELPTGLPQQWFSGGKYPENPYNTFGVPALHRVDRPGGEHPLNAVLNAGSAGAFWYNAANGVVRARVPAQGSRAATTALYCEVNGINTSDAAESAVAAGG
ncbi:MAG: prepilin-type N-terminal cleavage/methylation domain-containing protein [Planctomycetota bacterium]